jgi:SAM-dependent methyltransferase
MQADLRAYWRDCFKQIQGWTDSRLLEYLVLLGEIQHTRCVKGNIAEIGVFDGRFFLALAHLAAPHEKCVAIDVFEDQQYNIGSSSPGAPKNFESNWEHFAPQDAALVVIRADSLSLTIADRIDICRQHGPFRLFSIDGGHTADHVENDLAFAQDTLAPGGVIIADDYLHPHWHGVTEGVQNFVARRTSKMKPFLFIGNKLFLCSVSVHARYLQTFANRMGSQPRCKMVGILGWQTLAVLPTHGVID